MISKCDLVPLVLCLIEEYHNREAVQWKRRITWQLVYFFGVLPTETYNLVGFRQIGIAIILKIAIRFF